MVYDIELCVKVGEKQWVESLRDGTICFNPIETFIEKAEKEGNNEQGDKYEGVFARIKANDVRLVKLRRRFGDDLEEIVENGYILLRRKSSRKVPIFCTYGVGKDELKLKDGTTREENGENIGIFDYDFPEKIHNGFLSCADTWGYYASSGHFYKALEDALDRQHLLYVRTKITYDIDLSKEFYFEPDSKYSELTHKRKELEYQHEIRYLLLNFPRNDKYLLRYEPLSERSSGIASGAVRLEMECVYTLLEE